MDRCAGGCAWCDTACQYTIAIYARNMARAPISISRTSIGHLCRVMPRRFGDGQLRQETLHAPVTGGTASSQTVQGVHQHSSQGGTGLALQPLASVQVSAESCDSYGSDRKNLLPVRRTHRNDRSHATAATHIRCESVPPLPAVLLPWLVCRPTRAMKDVAPPFSRARAL